MSEPVPGAAGAVMSDERLPEDVYSQVWEATVTAHNAAANAGADPTSTLHAALGATLGALHAAGWLQVPGRAAGHPTAPQAAPGPLPAPTNAPPVAAPAPTAEAGERSESAAQFLAEESRSLRFAGEGWRRLLTDSVEYAVTQAEKHHVGDPAMLAAIREAGRTLTKHHEAQRRETT